MSSLSDSLRAAADKADQRAAEAIADGDPEAAEVAMKNAAHFRLLATNHRAHAIMSGDASHDPPQITEAPTGISGPELLSIRTALGMTQTQLAAALGTTQNTIARWERGAVPITHPVMLRLALEAITARHMS